MKELDLKLITNEQTILARSQEDASLLPHRQSIREAPKPIRARSSRYLDVDGVLARSLPKVAGAQKSGQI